MSEKRKPSVKIVAEFPGNGSSMKRVRVELFPSEQFAKRRRGFAGMGTHASPGRYRVRVDGRWSDVRRGKGPSFLTITDVMRQLRQLIVGRKFRPSRRLPVSEETKPWESPMDDGPGS